MASSNEKTAEREALESEARELKLKGAHMGSDENLRKRINEKKEELALDPEKPRSIAPRMNISGINRDDRTAKIAELEALDPDCKYVFQSSNITDRELKAKGLERTEHTVKNDILCRTLKDSFVEYQDVKNQSHYEAMKALEGENSSYEVPCNEARAKTPRS